MCTEARGADWRGWLLLLLGLFFLGEHAQAQTTHQQAYWLRLYLRGELGKKWSWHWELDERRLIRPDRQLQFITHAHLRRKLSGWADVAVGGSHSVVNERPEWRLFQELHCAVPLSARWRWTNRFRTEQRCLQQTDSNWQWRHRLRYRAQLGYKISAKWSARLSDEAMWHTDEFDQNRLYAAVERRCSKMFSWEVGYLKLYQKRAETAYFDRDIVRCTFYLNF
jgi:hypothetical protein